MAKYYLELTLHSYQLPGIRGATCEMMSVDVQHVCAEKLEEKEGNSTHGDRNNLQYWKKTGVRFSIITRNWLGHLDLL